MRRVISLYLPNWPTDRFRKRHPTLPAETPLALLTRIGNRRIVVGVDKAAKAEGIHIGMPATQAAALVAGLMLEDADVQGDEEALERLGQWMFRHYSPLVCAAAPDGLRIDATGVAHLFGGEASMLRRMLGQLKDQGFTARAAMAPTYGAAHALARFRHSSTLISSPEECEQLLAALPVAGLRLPAKTVDGLRLLGFETIQELCETPRAPLALRFGPQIGQRLDHVFGKQQEPFEPITPKDMLIVSQNFAEPIATPEQLAHFTGQLVQKICGLLEKQQSGARMLDLQFHRIDNRIEAIRIGLAKPARDTKRLAKLLTDKLETIDPGLGLERITLAAPWVESLALQQVATRLGERPQADMASLIDTLTNRLGPGHIYRALPVESQIPERACKKVEPLGNHAVASLLPHHWPRPVRLFAHPQAIETMALLPDRPPVSFTWKGIRRKVVRADGPERIFGEWWLHEQELYAVRDYFQVEDENGMRFWLFRAGDGMYEITGPQTWFIHGVFA